MSQAGQRNFEVVGGDALPIRLVYKSGSPPLPVDLTGYTAAWGFYWRNGTTIVRASVALTVNALGEITGSVSGPTTATFGPDAKHQVRLTAPNGDPTTILAGRVIVSPSAFA